MSRPWPPTRSANSCWPKVVKASAVMMLSAWAATRDGKSWASYVSVLLARWAIAAIASTAAVFSVAASVTCSCARSKAFVASSADAYSVIFIFGSMRVLTR